MKLFALKLLLLLFIPFYSTAQVFRDTTTSSLTLEKAQALYIASEFDQALELTKKLIDRWEATKGDRDTLLAKSYVLLGKIYSELKKFDAGKEATENAINAGGDDKSIIIQAYNVRGDIENEKGNPELAISYFEKALEWSLEFYGTDHEYTANNYNDLGTTLIVLGRLDEATKNLEQSLEIRRRIYGADSFKLAYPYNNLGNVYRVTGELNRAVSHYQEAARLLIDEFGEKNPKIPIALNNIGATLVRLGDFDRAREYHEKALAIQKELFKGDNLKMAHSYINLGNVMNYKEEYHQSLPYYEEALRILKAGHKGLHPDIGMTYNSMGVTWKNLKEYEKAVQAYRASAEVYRQTSGEEHRDMIFPYTNIGVLHVEQGAYKKSFPYFEKTLDICKKNYGEKHPFTAQTISFWGYALTKDGEYEQARKNFQKALEILNYELFSESFSDVNDIYILLRVLQSFEAYYKARSQSLTDAVYLDSLSLNYYQLMALENYMQQGYSELASRQFHIASIKPVYERAIETKLHQNSPEDLSLAFEYSEKIKSRLLTEGVRMDSYANYAGLPDSIRRQETNLTYDITKAEKKTFEAAQYAQTPDSLIKQYKREIFELKRSQENLIENLKQNYPDYWNLKYNFEVSTVPSVQEALDDNELVLEYFVGDSSLYVFAISSTAYVAKQLPRTIDLERQIEQLRKSIFAYSTEQLLSKIQKDSINQVYLSTAYELYQMLIQPVQEEVSHKKKLVIIPDGVLGYLPFDVLLTAPVLNFKSYKTLPYLLRKHEVSYAYSATLLSEMQKKRVMPKSEVLAFAPSFPEAPMPLSLKNARDSLYRLRYNVTEVEAINQLWPGQYYIGENAQLQHFLNEASDYRILHLSTHGKADDRVGDYCFLAFTKTNDTLDHLLYARDLYNMRLNAEMVVLSACETGLGQLQQGEGILSLARGFAYAGSKSIISTLWSVNEQSTKDIMERFYANLKKGMTKDEALRAAKLNYLNSPKPSAPFYWAAFSPVGDMKALETNSFNWVYILLIVLGISLFLVLLRRK